MGYVSVVSVVGCVFVFVFFLWVWVEEGLRG